MGLLDKAREAFGGQDNEFSGEFEDTEPELGPEPEPEPEPQVEEWDSAYQFAEEFLEEDGFADMQEFINKAMMYRVEQSPLFRDRIKSGVETMGMITSSMRDVKELKGEFSSESDYEQFAQDIRAANQIMDELDRLGGKEEQLANEILGLGYQVVDALNTRNSPVGGGVETGIERTSEEI